MSYENKPLTGVLFKQEPKTDKHPDFKGRLALADGAEVEVSGWFARDRQTGQHRKDKNGNRWINLKLGGGREKPKPDRDYDPINDPIPF